MKGSNMFTRCFWQSLLTVMVWHHHNTDIGTCYLLMQSAPNSLMFTWLTEANMLLQHWSGVLRSNTVKSISSWKTHGEPMGCSKLELLGSNNFHICHARRVHYVVSHCYPVSSFHIDILLILLPTKLLRTSSTWHRNLRIPAIHEDAWKYLKL